MCCGKKYIEIKISVYFVYTDIQNFPNGGWRMLLLQKIVYLYIHDIQNTQGGWALFFNIISNNFIMVLYYFVCVVFFNVFNIMLS